MSGDTHVAAKVSVSYGRSLAICYVRFPTEKIDNAKPTCPWCRKKLAEKGLRHGDPPTSIE